MSREHRPSKAYFTPPELARELGVAAEKIIAWIRSGELAAIDVSERRGNGRPRYRVRAEEWRQFLERREVGAEPTPCPRARRPRRPDYIEFI